jgi:hypothetical protein
MTRRKLLPSLAALAAAPLFLQAAAKPTRASLKIRRTAAKSAKGASIYDFAVTADAPFPVRALDPVLVIGEVTLRDYRYQDIENLTLIFTCSEPEKLVSGAVSYVIYEGDESSRLDLPLFHRNELN